MLLRVKPRDFGGLPVIIKDKTILKTYLSSMQFINKGQTRCKAKI